jgi:hypothetical protein
MTRQDITGGRAARFLRDSWITKAVSNLEMKPQSSQSISEFRDSESPYPPAVNAFVQKGKGGAFLPDIVREGRAELSCQI